jgi:hypothetical protein
MGWQLHGPVLLLRLLLQVLLPVLVLEVVVLASVMLQGVPLLLWERQRGLVLQAWSWAVQVVSGGGRMQTGQGCPCWVAA